MRRPTEDVRLVVNTFEAVFRPSWARQFGTPTSGLSDGNEGVQWNAWIDPVSKDAFLGVNLEGKQYQDWPISRLILRELDQPTLLGVIREVKPTDQVELVWWRDAWAAGGSRIPNFREHIIAPTPVALSDLTEDRWRSALEEALACLDAETNHRGRAKQTITLTQNGGEERAEHWVTPHLQFRYRLWQSDQQPTRERARAMMKEGRELLEPLHAWATGLVCLDSPP